jgi:hypothetical protein
VRLDHLLSKEHLASKDAQEPTVRGWRAGVLEGGDTGEFTAGDGPGCEYGRRGRPLSGVSVWVGKARRVWLVVDGGHPVGS